LYPKAILIYEMRDILIRFPPLLVGYGNHAASTNIRSFFLVAASGQAKP
jgi:hypothetical protein